MGIRGLTTFINNRSHLYLQDHELHDCNVVLDGNSIASNLYKWHCKSNDCFGGDYDKFAHIIRNFFDLLSQCNITPYVILDGGYEKRKLATVISRMKNKIRAAEALNSVTESSDSVFPLFLREVFVDIVLSLDLKVARCEFEGDMEIAGIAKTLECPVISYDSDFYVFGCIYIPFTTVDLTARKGKEKSTKNPYTYLSCKIYHIEKFLQAFGGLDRNILPILAVLLGNDYVKGSLFTPFFRNLKIQKCNSNQSDQQKRIKSVIMWLQNENIESAIKTVLGRFKDAKRQVVSRKIRAAMKGYFEINSELLEFLGIRLENKEALLLDFDKFNKDLTMSAEEIKESSLESDDCSSENETEGSAEHCESIADDQDLNTGIEEDINSNLIFNINFRKCQYPSCFMDMITLNRYYCIPQVEDSSFEHSHTISLRILAALYEILSCKKKELTIVCRHGKGGITFAKLPRTNEKFPTLDEINNLCLEDRKRLLQNVLQIDNKFLQTLTLFPLEWHLFLLTLKYSIIKSPFDKSLIYSCIVCFIILHYVDNIVGFYRVSKTFEKKFASFLLKNKFESAEDGFERFENLPYTDCIVFMGKMISYFQMDIKLKSNYRLYDKVLVHSLSQLQSAFLHVKYLNSLLNNCYPPLQIHKTFDGTFIYNMTTNFRKRSNLKDYLELFLKDCPSILAALTHVLALIEHQFDFEAKVLHPVKKRRKKKHKKSEKHIEEEKISENEEMEETLDPNNPYSVLAIL